jgi:hypothetical protein
VIAFTITPLSGEIANAARTQTHDAYGNLLVVRTEDTENAPCRVCLTRVAEGTGMILFSHSPFDRQNPYKEVGPIFVHAETCAPYATSHRLPPQIRQPVVLRGYTRDQEIHRAAVVVAGNADEQLQSLLADPEVAYVQARSITNGCYLYRIDRA